MCLRKTSWYSFIYPLRVGALIAKRGALEADRFCRFGWYFGAAFQIQDDILNITGEKFAKTKGLGEDIHEGKRTLMVIYCLAKAPKADATKLRGILNSHPSNQKVIDEAISILIKNGSIEYAKKRAKEIVLDAWSDIDKTFSPSEAKEKIKAFANYLIERDV